MGRSPISLQPAAYHPASRGTLAKRVIPFLICLGLASGALAGWLKTTQPGFVIQTYTSYQPISGNNSGVIVTNGNSYQFAGDNTGYVYIGGPGAQFRGVNDGSMVIDGYGSFVLGSFAGLSAVTNRGRGSLLLGNLSAGQRAVITDVGNASILLGAGMVSNSQAIVVGDGNESHGVRSVTADSFWGTLGGFHGAGGEQLISHAPANGAQYVSKDGAWQVASLPTRNVSVYDASGILVESYDNTYIPRSVWTNWAANYRIHFAPGTYTFQLESGIQHGFKTGTSLSGSGIGATYLRGLHGAGQNNTLYISSLSLLEGINAEAGGSLYFYDCQISDISEPAIWLEGWEAWRGDTPGSVTFDKCSLSSYGIRVVDPSSGVIPVYVRFSDIDTNSWGAAEKDDLPYLQFNYMDTPSLAASLAGSSLAQQAAAGANADLILQGAGWKTNVWWAYATSNATEKTAFTNVYLGR